MKYHHKNGVKKSNLLVRILLIVLPIVILFGVGGYIGVSQWYSNNLQPLSSESTEEIIIVIESGSSVEQIAQKLEENGVIKSATAFSWYIEREGLRTDLQAGTYSFSPSQSVEEIAEKIVNGDIDTSLFTILPGKRIDEIAEHFIESGYDESDVTKAMQGQYVENSLFEDKPENTTLEGYIYPETYQTTLDSTPASIIKHALDTFDTLIQDSGVLTGLADQDLTLHEAVILASIVQNESADSTVQPTVAQVFIKRYREGIKLGADPTFFYAAAITGEKPSPDLDHPYNTRIYAGLPPGPISNFNFSALEAVANPSDTDYLYFVAGDDGNTYFSHTLAEHEALTAEHCIELCKIPD